MRSTGDYDYSETPYTDAQFDTEFDQSRFDLFNLAYEKKVKQKNVIPIDVFLENTCRVITFDDNNKKCFNSAGVLLFSKNPQKYIPYSKIKCTKFLGAEITANPKILDSFECEGNLIELINSAADFVKKNIRNRALVIGTTTQYELEYPEASFREAIINAIMGCFSIKSSE